MFYVRCILTQNGTCLSGLSAKTTETTRVGIILPYHQLVIKFLHTTDGFLKICFIVCAACLLLFFRLWFILKKCTKSFAAIAHWMQYADDWSFVYMRWGLQIFLPCNQMARVFCPSGDKTNFRYCLHEMKWMTRHGHCAHWVSNDAKEMLFLFSNVWNGIESINTVLFALG